MRDGWQRQRVTSSPSGKTRRLGETVASCGGLNLRDRKRDIGSGRVNKEREGARNYKKRNRHDVENGEDSGGRSKKHRQESAGSVDVDQGH